MPPDAIAGLTPSQYLARLAAEATSVVMAADYAHQIRELAARREIIAAGQDLIEAGNESGGLTSRLVAAGGIERLDEIVALDGRTQATRLEIGRAADSATTQIADLMRNPGQRSVTWGLRDLNEMAPCLKPGNLVVLAGRPGMGKSAIAEASMLRAARAGSRVLFFSLEMTAEELAARAIADLCYDRRQPIAYFDLQRGKVADADWDRIEDARRILHGMPFVIEEQPRFRFRRLRPAPERNSSGVSARAPASISSLSTTCISWPRRTGMPGLASMKSRKSVRGSKRSPRSCGFLSWRWRS
jgi:replicative DNA helicase